MIDPSMPPLNAIDSSEHFDAAIEAIQKRVPMPKDEWLRLSALERESAFTVAHVSEADVLQQVLDSLESAVTHGTDFEQFKDDCYLKLLESWGGERPAHLETVFRTNLACVLPGQVVSGRVVAASRALYEGEAIQLRTVGGRRVSVTPNHPVLTSRGFVPAKNIRHGDHVLCNRRGVQNGASPSVAEESNQHRPASIDEIFGTLAKRDDHQLARTLGPLDLHGDAMRTDGKIEIVATNRKLLSHLKSRVSQVLGKVILSHAVMGLSAKPALRYMHSPVLGVLPSKHGFANAGTEHFRMCDSPLGRHSLEHERARHSHRAPRKANSLEKVVNLVVGKASRRGNGWNRFAILVALKEALSKFGGNVGFQPARFGSTAKLDSSLAHSSAQRGRPNADLLGQLLHGNPGLVTLDQVVEIGNRNLRSHVYDLQTEDGFYSTEQIYLSNCSYSEGRHSIYSSPTVKEARPYLRCDGADDDRMCEECEELHGVIRPQEDWANATPPFHHSCRHQLTPLSHEEAVAEGIDDEMPDVELDDGFGEEPSKQGENWDFNLDRFDPDLRELLEEKLAAYRDGGGED